MKITIDIPMTKEDTEKLAVSIWSSIYEDLKKRPELCGKGENELESESELDGILNKVIEKRIALLKRKIELSKRELFNNTAALEVLEAILAKINVGE